MRLFAFVLLLLGGPQAALAAEPFVGTCHGFSSQVLLVVAKSQDAKLEDDPSSNHAMTVGLQFSAMPLPLSSFIAFSFLGRCDNPMPRKTFGALVNCTLS